MANRTVTKRELCECISKQTGQPQVTTKQIIQLFLDRIISELGEGNRLELRNFGVFDTRRQRARRARNPKTNEVVHVEPKTVVTFKVGKKMEVQAQNGMFARPPESSP